MCDLAATEHRQISEKLYVQWSALFLPSPVIINLYVTLPKCTVLISLGFSTFNWTNLLPLMCFSPSWQDEVTSYETYACWTLKTHFNYWFNVCQPSMALSWRGSMSYCLAFSASMSFWGRRVMRILTFIEIPNSIIISYLNKETKADKNKIRFTCNLVMRISITEFLSCQVIFGPIPQELYDCYNYHRVMFRNRTWILPCS